MTNSETTPLSSGNAAGGINVGGVKVDTQAIKGAAAAVLTKENADKAKTFVIGQAEKLKKMASDGNMSLRMLALLGGFAMIVTSIMGIVGRILTLKFIGVIFDVYTFCLGVIVLFLEWDKFPQKEKYADFLRTYFYFLDFIWGRGVLYFVAGSIQFSLMSILDLAVGGFMCFVGVLYIIVGRITAKKLAAVHKSVYSDHAIQAKFNEADVEGVGTINVEQFGNLTKSFGMELEKREVEIAFLEVPKATKEEDRVSLEGFRAWWTKSEQSFNDFVQVA